MKLGFNTQNYSTTNQNKSRAIQCRKNVSFGDSLGIIKPEAMRWEKLIFDTIKNAGFEVVEMPKSTLPKDMVKQHYSQLRQLASTKFKEGKNFLMNVYKRVERDMQNGPSKRFIIKGDEAEVQRFKVFVGATSPEKREPTSLRAIIERAEATRLKNEGAGENLINKNRARYTFVHASDTDWFDANHTIKNYDREIKLHNPKYYEEHCTAK